MSSPAKHWGLVLFFKKFSVKSEVDEGSYKISRVVRQTPFVENYIVYINKIDAILYG